MVGQHHFTNSDVSGTDSEGIHRPERAKNVYGSKKIAIPRPEFYVVYTGTDRKNVRTWYSLADEFLDGNDEFINLKVRILQADENSKDIVSQYASFTKILNDQVKKLGRTTEAVRHTIRICKNQDILKKYLEQRETEVISIMTTLFSQEEATKAYGRELKEEGKQEGRKEGRKEGQVESAERMIRSDKFSDSEIAGYSGLTVEEVKDLRKKIEVMA